MNYMYNNHPNLLQCSSDGTPKKSMHEFTDPSSGIKIEFSYTQNTLKGNSNYQGDCYEGIIASVMVDGREAVFNSWIWIYNKSPSHHECDNRFIHNEYVVFSEQVTNDFLRTDVGQSILKEVLGM